MSISLTAVSDLGFFMGVGLGKKAYLCSVKDLEK